MKRLQSLVLLVLAIGAIWGCGKLLQLQDQHEEQRAVERCGGQDNIVKHYTNQGDAYWTCAIEK